MIILDFDTDLDTELIPRRFTERFTELISQELNIMVTHINPTSKNLKDIPINTLSHSWVTYKLFIVLVVERKWNGSSFMSGIVMVTR
jgi:hypothetical protein